MTTPQILIVTRARDFHAYAVAEGLAAKGADPHLWHTSDFPTRARESVWLDKNDGGVSIHCPGFEGSGLAFNTVWNRRLAMVTDEDLFHVADRRFADGECREFRLNLLEHLSTHGFWVNPWRAGLQAENKFRQLSCARDVGLEIPSTLFSNDPERVLGFCDRHRGRVVYKAFRARPWSDGKRCWVPYTSRLELRDVDSDTLQNAAGIYQELVEKSYELRVTVIGRRVFSAKLCSQETSEGRLDWKKAEGLKIETHHISGDLLEASLALMEQLGLVFGCLDFIVTPDERPVFLEVNQMGQFLFIEEATGMPLLDAFCELLLQSRCDFDWTESRAEVRFTPHFDAKVRSKSRRLQEQHVPLPVRYWQE